MKKYLIIGLSFLLALSSCVKEAGFGDDSDSDAVVYGKRKVSYWMRSPKSLRWRGSDNVGVYSSKEANAKFTIASLPDGKTQLAFYTGPLITGSTLYGAYYPYNASAGNSGTKVSVSIPSKVTYGTDLTRFDVAPYREGEDVPFVFQRKLSTVKISFTNVTEAWARECPIKTVTIKGARAMTGRYEADMLHPYGPLSEGETSDQIVIDMHKTPLTADLVVPAAVAATWKQGDEVEITINRARDEGDVIDDFNKVTLQVAADAQEGEDIPLVVNAPDLDPVLPVLKLDWVSAPFGAEDGKTQSQIRGNTPAVDQAGNVYIQPAMSDSYGTNRLYKLSGTDGSILWKTNLLGYAYSSGGSSSNASPSCEPDGSTVYLADGKSGTGRVVAVNGADGSVKWTLTPDKFFGDGTDPAPNIDKVHVVIGSTHVYVGNNGTAGSALSLDKNTGERTAYVSNAADGTGGPQGGAASGMGLSKGGQLAWFCKFGIFTAEQSKLDNPTQTHATYGAYTTWAERFWHGWTYNQAVSGIAMSRINGQDVVWAAPLELTKQGAYKHHVMAKAITPNSTLAYTQKAFLVDRSIDVAEDQKNDQIGIVIGPRGEAIVGLKGEKPRLVAVDASGDIAWEYQMPSGKDIVGAAAVDNNGFIHIVTDYNKDGDGCLYSILRPNYSTKTCSVVASAKVDDLIQAAGIDLSPATTVRCWSSMVIGQNGKVYVGASAFTVPGRTNMTARVLCFSYGNVITGPSTVSPWPQYGADSFHTGRQK